MQSLSASCPHGIPGLCLRPLGIALALLSWGCGGGGEPRAQGQPTVAEASAAPAGEPSSAPSSPARTVEILLDEYVITMPAVLPPGPITIRLRNRGFEEHNFEIRRGDEVLWRVSDPLNPGATATLGVDLEPGQYWVICPVSGHDGRGMMLELTVNPDAGAAPGTES